MILLVLFCVLSFSTANLDYYFNHYELIDLKVIKLQDHQLHLQICSKSVELNVTLKKVGSTQNLRSSVLYESSDSELFAAGFLDRKNAFTGVVQLGKDTGELCFLEDSSIYLSNRTLSREVILYKESDIIHPAARKIQQITNSLRRQPKVTLKHDEPKLNCRLEIVADNGLYRLLGSETYPFLNLHQRYVDYLFQHLAIGPKQMHISLKNLGLLDIDFFPNKATSLHDLLNTYSERIQTYCISICLSDRIVDEHELGISFYANKDSSTGVCASPTTFHGKYHSFNTGLLTIRDENGTRLPLGVTLPLFANIIGYSFQNSTVFRIKSIKSIIMQRMSCFEESEAKCGNGIREDHEECDCGWDEICDLIDPCCSLSGNGTGCTLKKGYTCSRREDPNCNADCTNAIDCCSGKRCETVCAKNQMERCSCDPGIHSCQVCCKTSKNNCVPIYTALDQGLRRAPGTTSLDDTRICDKNGYCILMAEINKTIMKRKVVAFIFMTIMGFIIVDTLCGEEFMNWFRYPEAQIGLPYGSVGLYLVGRLVSSGDHDLQSSDDEDSQFSEDEDSQSTVLDDLIRYFF